jgi:hypothetical protein
MRKFTTAALAALALVGGTTAATSADAQTRYYRGGDRTGTAIVAGIAGLALGAALSSRGGYGYGYGYGPSYSYGYPSYGYGSGYGYYGPSYGYDSYYGRPYAPRYRARICTFWRHDRWGRAYPVQGRC